VKQTEDVRPLKRSIRLSELSPPWQVLVRLCQAIDFGQISDLHVRDMEPRYTPAPKVLRDIKLDADDSARTESELADFAVPEEVCRLVAQIEAMGTGCIQKIEVRAGVPRRVLLEVAPLENPQ